jgi:cyclophilin family peptidyl-prolyl cis-trans isomerase
MKTAAGLTAACILALAPGGRAGAAPLPPKFLNPDVVVLDTSLGVIRIKLYPQQAPDTVANFLRYVDDKFYDNTVFHRVIPAFMIQGGGYDVDLREKKGRPPIKNEAANGLSKRRGTIAMARTVAPDSATSQFYINVKDNVFLDRAKAADGVGYCVFGEVVAGMDVVDKIKAVATGTKGPHANVPIVNVVIKSIRRANQ